MTSPPYEFLGPYRIGVPLGRGGMGTVYAAVHEKTGQPVAVKLISDSVADEEKFRRRFDAEIKSLQCLSHVGIVRIYGFGEEHGHLFYSMELVKGDSLQKVIRTEKRLEWRTTIDVAIQVCAALKHAHDIGVIHRDLKPANLVVDEQWNVKLVDFGIAKIFGDSNTLAGSLLGTADFMAPEQATSEGITQRTDLYALGSVMYAMLAGRAPFTGKSITQVINSLQRDRPVPIDMIQPDLPEELVELIHQLLEKEPSKRPPTALAVMNRLKAMRMGLDRLQTVVAEDLQTEVGGDPSTGAVTNNEAPSHSSNSETAAEGKSQLLSDGLVVVSPEEPTVVSVGGVGPTRSLEEYAEDEAEDEAEEANTHFQTVTDSYTRTGVFSEEPNEAEGEWVKRGKTFLMAAFLVGAIVLFALSMRSPDADELFAKSMNGDSAAMHEFLNYHFDDPRYTEVQDLKIGTKLRGTLNRLQAQSKLGITALQPFEEGFSNAMEERELNPTLAAMRIKQWLNVFDLSNTTASDELRGLIILAEYERKRLLERVPLDAIDSRAGTLLTQIRKATASGDADRIDRELNGIIETFREAEWAEPAVREAQEQLDSRHKSEVPVNQAGSDEPIQ